VDDVSESDLVEESDGLTFIMNPKNYELAGEVTITYAVEGWRQGFVLSSSNTISEWQGFSITEIKI